MKVLSSYNGGLLTLFFKGELDHHEAKATADRIDRLIDEYLPRDCIMDMSGLTFMDSSGIAVIMRIYRRLNQSGGRAWVENASRQSMRVIDASGIDRLIRISAQGGAAH